MKNMFTAIMAVTLFGLGAAFAADGKPTKEEREKMAQMHMQMADCLKSDKSMGECHEEMEKSCMDTMGKDGCPMMKHKMKMKRGGMMKHKGEESATESKK